MMELFDPNQGQAVTVPFNNSYAALPKRFFAAQNPTPVAAPKLIKFNASLARDMGLIDAGWDGPGGAEILSGNQIAKGSTPIAMAYAGHQFGNWVPQLGDGRAVLLGEVVGPDTIRRDIQLKGAGRTPFSRGGDGRAVIGAILREYIVSEAMAALNIPTTRALAIVTTGESVMREGPEPGAILTRVAQSHVRVGTFQYFYARQDTDALRTLTDYVILRNYPEVATLENPTIGFLNAVISRQANLIAKWMGVGFVHGVMNTDNMSVAGETIDYGPCAFMDEFHPETCFSSIDRQRRYAWGNQPAMAHWNLAQLAQALLPVIDADEDTAMAMAQASLDVFSDVFSSAYYDVFNAKIGLSSSPASNRTCLDDLLILMAEHQIDFTRFFTDLTRFAQTQDSTFLGAHFESADDINSWVKTWQNLAKQDGTTPVGCVAQMQAANPVFIPRNHRVQAAILAANTGDYTVFEKLISVLANPFTEQPVNAEFEDAPSREEAVHQTFCGT